MYSWYGEIKKVGGLMEKIFKSDTGVELSLDNLFSFEDCPNHCVDGMIFDPYKHKRIVCKYCADKRLKVAKNDIRDKNTGKTISELLKIPVVYTGNEFSESLVIPEFSRKQMTEESVSNVLTKLRELITNISIGLTPDCSLLFNLGVKANEVNFIYPYLIKAYIAGKSLVPLVTLTDLCQLRLLYETQLGVSDKWGYSYQDLLERDVCIVVIDAGATYDSILAAKGLLQLRAQKYKPTIIFTNKWNKYVKNMCAEEDYKGYNLATLYSIEYLKSDDIQENTLMSASQDNQVFGTTPEALRSLMTAKNSL